MGHFWSAWYFQMRGHENRRNETAQGLHIRIQRYFFPTTLRYLYTHKHNIVPFRNLEPVAHRYRELNLGTVYSAFLHPNWRFLGRLSSSGALGCHSFHCDRYFISIIETSVLRGTSTPLLARSTSSASTSVPAKEQ